MTANIDPDRSAQRIAELRAAVRAEILRLTRILNKWRDR